MRGTVDRAQLEGCVLMTNRRGPECQWVLRLSPGFRAWLAADSGTLTIDMQCLGLCPRPVAQAARHGMLQEIFSLIRRNVGSDLFSQDPVKEAYVKGINDAKVQLRQHLLTQKEEHIRELQELEVNLCS